MCIINHVPDAGVAHPVERHLAKVEVASSSLVTRSIKDQLHSWSFLFPIINKDTYVPHGAVCSCAPLSGECQLPQKLSKKQKITLDIFS